MDAVSVVCTETDEICITIPKEQKGCRSGTKGCKDQLLISKAILQECKRRKKKFEYGVD
jgi:hypothetical protein